MPDLASLPKGFQFPQTRLCPTADEVAAYCRATGDEALAGLIAEAGVGAPIVPPLALAAWALRSLMQQYPLPAGVVHSSQEAAFSRMVQAGEEVYCEARVSNRSERAGGLFIVIDLAGRTKDGEPVFTARTTIGAGLA